MSRAALILLCTLACVSPEAAKEKLPSSPAPAAKAALRPDVRDPEPEREAALAAAERRSPIKADEEVMLFPVAAAQDLEAGVWRVPVHGWIYEPEVEDAVRNLMMTALREALGDDPGFSTDRFIARLQPFAWDNERGKRIPIEAAGLVFDTDASRTDGHFAGTLDVPIDAALHHALQYHGKDPPARLPVRAVTRAGDERRFETSAYLLPAEGLSVVSDIDDTVKITNVRDTTALLRNTFLEPFRPVPGMARVYGDWLAEASGAHLHFLSSSPWQLYPELVEMLDAAGFPDASFQLKTIRVHDASLLELLADPERAKTAAIENLLARFPRRRFALVGDSGERDPEIFGALARAHPGQVVYVAIRNVSAEDASHSRYAQAFRHVSARWEVFTDPATLQGPG